MCPYVTATTKIKVKIISNFLIHKNFNFHTRCPNATKQSLCTPPRRELLDGGTNVNIHTQIQRSHRNKQTKQATSLKLWIRDIPKSPLMSPLQDVSNENILHPSQEALCTHTTPLSAASNTSRKSWWPQNLHMHRPTRWTEHSTGCKEENFACKYKFIHDFTWKNETTQTNTNSHWPLLLHMCKLAALFQLKPRFQATTGDSPVPPVLLTPSPFIPWNSDKTWGEWNKSQMTKPQDRLGY